MSTYIENIVIYSKQMAKLTEEVIMGNIKKDDFQIILIEKSSFSIYCISTLYSFPLLLTLIFTYVLLSPIGGVL